MSVSFNSRQLTRILIVAALLLNAFLLEINFFLKQEDQNIYGFIAAACLTIFVLYFLYRDARNLPDPRLEALEKAQSEESLSPEQVAENKNYLIPSSDFAMAVLDRLQGRHEALYPCLREAVAFASQEKRPSMRISKIGGRPFLPQGFEWPLYTRRLYSETDLGDAVLLSEETGALPFLAQINLEELPEVEGRQNLPEKGILSFFVDFLDHKVSAKEGGVRVFYFDDDQGPFFETELPENLLKGLEIYNTDHIQETSDWEQAFPERWLSFVPVLRLYQYDDVENFLRRTVEEYDVPDADEYREFEQKLFRESLAIASDPSNFRSIERSVIYLQEMSEIEADFESVRHQMLGYPDSVSGGYYFTNSYDEKDLEATAETPHPYRIEMSETVLLLQVDSDIYCDLAQFGEEMGQLQFHMSLDDLKKLNFENVHLHFEG